jgi:hypothetical protein
MSQEQNTTIVTAYFKLPQSKASHEKYSEWMQNMLLIECPMIIFCDEISEKQIQEFREHFIEKTKIITMTFQEFHCYKYFNIFVNDYRTKDHERYHNPYLYLLWNEKSHFLKKAIEMNIFSTEFFLWVDIGCFRKQNTDFIQWPKTEKIPTNKILLLSVNPFTPEEYNCNEIQYLKNFQYDIGRIGGTIFGGTSQTILKWYNIYYQMLEYFISIERFVGKDQNIMNSVAIMNKDMVELIDPDDFKHDDRWFALQEYLS